MRDETAEERYDRNLLELLNELRVALPGVQVLFAFLLAVPFQQRWGEVTAFQRDVYFVTLCLVLISTILLIAPTAYHRLNFARGRKHEIVEVSNRLAIAGLGVLALSLVGAMVLITDVLFGTTMTVVVAVLALLVFAALWALLPLHHELRR